MAEASPVQLGLDLSVRGEGMALLVRGADVVELRAGLHQVASVAAAVRDLADAAGSQLAGVVVARGPGSYIGVRSALAAAIGLAQARRLPLGLVGSLAVVAHRVDPGPGRLVVAVGAGRGGLFVQRFTAAGGGAGVRWREVGPAEAMSLASPPDGALDGDLLLDPGSVVERPLGERVAAVRSGEEALALLIARGGYAVSGYDLVSADYGVRVGDPT